MADAAPRVLITRRIPDTGIGVLRQAGVAFRVLHDDEESGPSRETVLESARECDVLLSLLTEPIDESVLALPGLRGVANMAVGFDNIDVPTATRLGVPITNTPGVLTDATADLAFTLLLSIARRVPEAHRYTVDDRFRIWGPNLLLGADVGPGCTGRKKVLGVVGYGRIGAAVARRAAGFDMEILACSPSRRLPHDGAPEPEWVELDELLERSDFVTLHPPLNQRTRRMIGAAQLARMRRSAYLINTARGPIVDEVALVEALRAGEIAGAALDVYEDEPRLSSGLAELPNVVLLPHVGSATFDTRNEMARLAATNAVHLLRCERAPNTVNPEVYETAAYADRVREV